MSSKAQIVIGCEQLGGTDWGAIDENEIKSAISRAFDNGLRRFDTADVYGLGASEERLSQALGSRIHDAFIISKGGVRWEKGDGRARTWKDNSPAYLASALDDSLRRLNVDAIDLYFIHWPDNVTPIDEMLSFCETAKTAGKIKSFGLSNFPREAVHTAAQSGLGAMQSGLSLLSTEAEQRPFVEAGVLSLARYGYGALAQGLLTGKYSVQDKFGANDRRHRLSHFAQLDHAHIRQILDTLKGCAVNHNKTMGQIAVQALRQSGLLENVIVGVKSIAQIDDLLGLAGFELSPEALTQLFASTAWQTAALQPAND